MNTIKHINKMIELIDDYKNHYISLQNMHYNIESLFALIDDKDKSNEFRAMFHKHWDFIEEIIAIGKINTYLDTIDNDILPNFRIELDKKIMGLIDLHYEKNITTVNDLVENFRKCLVTIVPHLEKMQIEWREGVAYDEWDNIAESIYQAFIVSSVKHSTNFTEETIMPKYATFYEEVQGLSYMAIVSKKEKYENCIFYAFETIKEIFDAVSFFTVDDLGNVNNKKHILPIMEVYFVIVKMDNAGKEIFRQLEIQ